MKTVSNIVGVILIAVSSVLYIMAGGMIVNLASASKGWSAVIMISALIYFLYAGFLGKFSGKKKMLIGFVVSLVMLIIFAVATSS